MRRNVEATIGFVEWGVNIGTYRDFGVLIVIACYY